MIQNLTLAVGATKPLTGTIQLSAAQAALFPGQSSVIASVTDLSGSYNLELAASSLSLTAASVTLGIGEAIEVKANNVTFTPGSTIIATIASGSVSARQLTQFDIATVTNLAITRTGFNLGSLSIGQLAGQTAQIGNFLSVTGGVLTVENFVFSYSPTLSVTGVIRLKATTLQLFPNGGYVQSTTSNIEGIYQFSGGLLGALTINIANFTLSVGEALDITASNVVLTPGSNTLATIASAQVSSKQITGLSPVSITNLAILRTGFTLGNLTINQIGTAQIGNFLSITGGVLTVENFVFSYSPTLSVTGVIRLKATTLQLFPNGGYVQSTTSNIEGIYQFSGGLLGALTIKIANFTLSVGEALDIAASNVVLTPGSNTLATIASAQVSSKQITGLSPVSITNLAILRTGFTLGNLTINQIGTAQIGNFLSITGGVLTVENFVFSYSPTLSVTGVIRLKATTLQLFPNGGYVQSTTSNIEGIYQFSGGLLGALTINIANFTLSVGEALDITASNVVLTPGSNTLATIASAQVSSKQITGLSPVSIANLAILRTGFTLGNLTISQIGTAQFGNFLSVTGGVLTVENFAFSYFPTLTVTGIIRLKASSLQLYPNGGYVHSTMTDIEGIYQFSGGLLGALTINVANFSMSIGSALDVTASNIVLTPGSSTLVTIATAQVTAHEITGISPAYISNLVITRTGFSLGNLTVQQVGSNEVRIGTYLSFNGWVFSIENLVYDYAGLVMSGTVRFTAAHCEIIPGWRKNHRQPGQFQWELPIHQSAVRCPVGLSGYFGSTGWGCFGYSRR